MRFTMCLCVSLKDGREQPCGKGNKFSPTTGSRNALCENALVMPNASKQHVFSGITPARFEPQGCSTTPQCFSHELWANFARKFSRPLGWKSVPLEGSTSEAFSQPFRGAQLNITGLLSKSALDKVEAIHTRTVRSFCFGKIKQIYVRELVFPLSRRTCVSILQPVVPRLGIALLLAGIGAENPAALVRSGQTQDDACRMALQSRCAGAVSLSAQEFNDADVPEPPLVATDVRTSRAS